MLKRKEWEQLPQEQASHAWETERRLLLPESLKPLLFLRVALLFSIEEDHGYPESPQRSMCLFSFLPFCKMSAFSLEILALWLLSPNPAGVAGLVGSGVLQETGDPIPHWLCKAVEMNGMKGEVLGGTAREIWPVLFRKRIFRAGGDHVAHPSASQQKGAPLGSQLMRFKECGLPISLERKMVQVRIFCTQKAINKETCPK